MDLNEKIKQILSDTGMSPSIFADEVGIQRSSMSHILAGRNKPSLDIVQKIVKRFPELGTNWILDEEELPHTLALSGSNTDGGPAMTDLMRAGSNSVSKGTKLSAGNGSKSGSGVSLESQARRIEKILVFYSDGTFEEVK